MKNIYLTTVAIVAMVICAFCADAVQCEKPKPEQKTTLMNTATNPTCPSTGYINIAVPGDCTKYIYCMNGVGVPRQCFTGHYFNPNIGECDIIDPDNDCRPNNNRDPDCPAENCEGTLRLPYPSDCASYLECVNGQKVMKTCHPGLKFNRYTQMCDLPSYVNCDDYQCTPDTPNNTKVPHYCDCTLYYICQNGNSIIQQCPIGQKYDYIRKDCVSANIARCYDKSKINTFKSTFNGTYHD